MWFHKPQRIALHQYVVPSPGLETSQKEYVAATRKNRHLCDSDHRMVRMVTLNCRIALKFDRHIGSTAAEVPVKCQSDRTILNTNLAASRLYEILRKDVFSEIETGPWCYQGHTKFQSPFGILFSVAHPNGGIVIFSIMKTVWNGYQSVNQKHQFGK